MLRSYKNDHFMRHNSLLVLKIAFFRQKMTLFVLIPLVMFGLIKKNRPNRIFLFYPKLKAEISRISKNTTSSMIYLMTLNLISGRGWLYKDFLFKAKEL